MGEEQAYISPKQSYVDITRWAATTLVMREMFEDNRLWIEMKENGLFLDQLLFRLEVEILKDTHGRSEQVVTFVTPATWWDHWKTDVLFEWGPPFSWRQQFLGWLFKPVKWEARTKRVEWECASLFPEASYYPPKWGKRVKYVGVEQRWEELE